MKRRLLRASALALLACAACRNPNGPELESESPAYGEPAPGGPVVVTGTTIEARSGKPLANVVIRGPNGVETKSDERGRFVLRGLAAGTSGELLGTTESGLSARNLLRGLTGPLEVVLYLR